MDNVEDRLVKWKIYSNINSWFLNWEHDLEELGFLTETMPGILSCPRSSYSGYSMLMSPAFKWTEAKVGVGGDPALSSIHQTYH